MTNTIGRFLAGTAAAVAPAGSTPAQPPQVPTPDQVSDAGRLIDGNVALKGAVSEGVVAGPRMWTARNTLKRDSAVVAGGTRQ
jgi:hypothetical protein